MRLARPVPIALLAAVTLLPELAYWVGSLRCAPPKAAGPCSILLLGTPPRKDGSPHPLQRRRVDAAVEVMREADCSVMVISGGNPHSTHIEADVMGELARAAGIPPEKIILDRRARTTWENVRNAAPHLKSSPTIYVVSDTLHAHRGKSYLCRQRPDLCARIRPAGRYRFGDHYFYKWRGMAHEAGARLRDLSLIF